MRRLFPLALALSLLGAGVSFAQENASPRELAPRELSPNQGAARETQAITPAPLRSISGGINVQSLGSVSNEALGVLSGDDALPANMWAGSDRALIEALIKALPNTPSFAALRDVQTLMMLSTAEPPKGKSGALSLLGLRAQKLFQMGRYEDVIRLITASPVSERDETITGLLVESQLLTGDLSKACANAAVQNQTSRAPFWVKTLAYCRVLAKQGDQAMLSLSLLQEMGDNDPNFYRYIESLNNAEQVTVETLTSASSLELALIKSLRADVKQQADRNTDPNILRLLSTLETSTDEARAQALVFQTLADRKATEDLRAAYLALSFSEAQLGDPLSTSEELDNLEAQALLYQVAAKPDQLPVIQSEAANLALELARTDGTFLQSALVFSPLISELRQSIDLLWFAPNALRAQLIAGNLENAARWYQMLRNAAFTDPEAQANWTQVRPLAIIAGFDVAQTAVDQTLELWWQAQPAAPQSFQTATSLFSIIDGMGFGVADARWLALQEGPSLGPKATPKAGLWIKMNKASLAGRMGEALLLTINGLSPMDRNNIEPAYLRDVLFALRALGLDQYARKLAIEAALQTGL